MVLSWQFLSAVAWYQDSINSISIYSVSQLSLLISADRERYLGHLEVEWSKANIFPLHDECVPRFESNFYICCSFPANGRVPHELHPRAAPSSQAPAPCQVPQTKVSQEQVRWQKINRKLHQEQVRWWRCEQHVWYEYNRSLRTNEMILSIPKI